MSEQPEQPGPDQFEEMLAALHAGVIEPSADARAAALAMRQFFLALTSQGFTDEQALYLTATVFSQRGFRP